MTHRSMFAVYIYEDADGEVSIRADSYGDGEKAIFLGMDLLDTLTSMNNKCGGEAMIFLSIDRCESVQ